MLKCCRLMLTGLEAVVTVRGVSNGRHERDGGRVRVTHQNGSREAKLVKKKQEYSSLIEPLINIRKSRVRKSMNKNIKNKNIT
jgi:hypothetical protein